MSFQWNVQPYRWLYQLREEYVSAMFVAGAKKGRQQAIEAEAWMKANAPWQDRTDEERFKAGVSYPLGARAGLRAYVTEDDGSKEHMEALAELQSNNAYEAKKVVSANRTAEKNIAKAARELRSRIRSGEIPRSKEPIGMSRIYEKYRFQEVPDITPTFNAMNREFRSNRIPLVSIKFSHHEKVLYGIWLEIAKGGRYGIISRAVEHWGRKFMNEVTALSNLKQYRDRIIREGNPDDSQRFDMVAAAETLAKGREYKPWNRATMTPERARRRKYYDYDEYLEKKAKAAADLLWRQSKEGELAAYQEKMEGVLQGKIGGTVDFSKLANKRKKGK